jgi:hypothetical protein
MSQASQPKSLGRRLLTFFAVAAALLGAVAFWIWNGPAAAPRNPLRPFVAEREADGSWPPLPSEERAFEVSFGATERRSQTQTSTRQGVTAAQNARFACRSILVTTRTDRPLEQAIAARVVAGLQQDDYVRQVRYRSATAEVPVGVARPDLVVDIELRDVDDDTLLGSGEGKAELVVHVGTGMRRGSVHRTEDQPAPPRIDLDLEVTVQSTFEQGGFATPNLVFASIADELAAPVCKHFDKEFAALREQYGVQPYLPPGFAVAFRPVDERFDVARLVPEGVPVRLLAAWNGPLMHNESWWSARIDGTVQGTLEWVEAAMAEMGYQPDKVHTRSHRIYRAGDVVITVDAMQPRRRVGVLYRADEPQPEVVDLSVRYRHRADRQLVAAAFEGVLGDGVAPEVLLACLAKMKGDAHERGLQRVGALELDEPSDLVLRARARDRAGDAAGAADDLLRALLFADVSFDRRKQVEKVESAAKSLKIELDRYGVAPEWLRDNGFFELQKDGEAVEATATGSEPVRCFVMSKDGDGRDVARLFAVGPDRSSSSGEWLGSILVFDHGHTSSQGRGGSGERTYPSDFGTIHYEFVDDPADARADVRVRLR